MPICILAFNLKRIDQLLILEYNILGKTIPQVALRWLVQKNVVSSVIIGATSVAQVENNMGASSGWSITLDEVKQICTFI